MVLSGMLAWGRTRIKTNRAGQFARVARWLPVAAWMGGIFYLSQQSQPLGTTATTMEATAAHLGFYAVLAFLVFVSISTALARRPPTPWWILAGVALAFTVLYGVTDEIHQSFVPGRTASEADVAVDAVGAALGVAAATIATLLLRGRRRRA